MFNLCDIAPTAMKPVVSDPVVPPFTEPAKPSEPRGSEASAVNAAASVETEGAADPLALPPHLAHANGLTSAASKQESKLDGVDLDLDPGSVGAHPPRPDPTAPPSANGAGESGIRSPPREDAGAGTPHHIPLPAVAATVTTVWGAHPNGPGVFAQANPSQALQVHKGGNRRASWLKPLPAE